MAGNYVLADRTGRLYAPDNNTNLLRLEDNTVQESEYATQRTGQPFVLCVCQIMGWDPGNRYRILGKKLRSETDEEILLFDLRAGQSFAKPSPGEKGKKNRSTILTGWNGVFGPNYGDSKGSLQLDTFDGYTVFSIKGKQPAKAEQAEEQLTPEVSHTAEDETCVM